MSFFSSLVRLTENIIGDVGEFFSGPDLPDVSRPDEGELTTPENNESPRDVQRSLRRSRERSQQRRGRSFFLIDLLPASDDPGIQR